MLIYRNIRIVWVCQSQCFMRVGGAKVLFCSNLFSLILWLVEISLRTHEQCSFSIEINLLRFFFNNAGWWQSGDSWCTPASVASSPKCLNRLCLTVFSSLPCCLCTFSSFQSTLHLICFDTALLEQHPLSVMPLCDLPSVWGVSMIVFWTIAKSTVFPIIVVSKNKRYLYCTDGHLLKLMCKYSNILRYWLIFHFH